MGDFFSTHEQVRKIECALKWKGAEKDRVSDILKRLVEKESIFSLDVESLVAVIMEAKENCRLTQFPARLNPVP